MFLLSLGLAARAQVYTIVGGGGTSTGGVSAVQTPGAPLLSVERDGASVRVSWPLPATGFVLDQTAAMAAAPADTVWSQVPVVTYQTNAMHISYTVLPVTVPPARFYRLRLPS